MRRPLRWPHAGQPVAAAGHVVPLEHDRPGDLRKRQRQHGEVYARQPHAEPAIEQRTARGHQGAEHQRGLHRQIQMPHQQGRAIRAQTKVRRVAKRVHAARAENEMQAGRKQRRDRHVGEQHRRVAFLAHHQRQAEEHQQQGDPGRGGAASGRAHRQLIGRRVARERLRLAHQAPGPPDQHRGHHQKLHHQREFGERNLHTENLLQPKPDAHGLQLGNQQRRDKRTGNAAHAAHHHHDKRRADREHVHLQTCGFARQLQRAAQTRQQRAQGKHRREQPGLIHAQRAHHLAVLCGRAHQSAETGLGEQQMQTQQDQRTHGDQQQVVGRELPPEDFHRAFKTDGARAEQLLGSPDPERRILDDQHQRKRGEQLKQLGGLVDAPQQQHFGQRAQRAAHQRCQQQRGPETDVRRKQVHAGIGDERAQHVERAMRKVDAARDTKDQRQPDGYQEQRRGAGKAVEQLREQARKAHAE